MTPQELKNSVLQLAIQGKLVEQRAEEGTGEQLYREILAEKAKLVKAGKIKKEKPLPEIAADEKPFDIPEGWCWARLGNVGSWNAGATPSRTNPQFYDGNIPWLKTGDLNDGPILETSEYITDLALEKNSLQINPVGAVLMAMYGATIGKLGILSLEATTNQACCACFPLSSLSNIYLFYYLMAIRKSFVKMGAGGAQPNISKEKIVHTLIPLPPLAEQKRIVSKIEELLPYIDRYEQAWRKLEDFNKRFPDNMQKSILQFAIQGKLVEQRPEEGTGEALYKQIQAEKQRLIKAGTIRKEKPLPEITEEEKPFDIPESWKWVRFGNIANKLTDGTHSTPKYTSTGIPFVSVKDMSSGKLDFSSTKYISVEEHTELFKRCNPEFGDLLISKIGTTGVPAIVDTNLPFSLFVSVALMKFSHDLLNVFYLYYLVFSPLVENQAKENTRGVGNKNWVLDKIRNSLVPLPPLAEQKRIVAKLEEILPLCEKLKR